MLKWYFAHIRFATFIWCVEWVETAKWEVKIWFSALNLVCNEKSKCFNPNTFLFINLVRGRSEPKKKLCYLTSPNLDSIENTLLNFSLAVCKSARRNVFYSAGSIFVLNHNKRLKFMNLQYALCSPKIQFVFIQFGKCFTVLNVLVFSIYNSNWHMERIYISCCPLRYALISHALCKFWTSSGWMTYVMLSRIKVLCQIKQRAWDMKCNTFENKHVTLKLPPRATLVLMFPFKF